MVDKRQTAAKYGAELQKDPEFVRRRQQQEERIQADLEKMYQAEAPLVAALADVGVRVKTVWDLANTKAQYPAALPILFEHLYRPYPPVVLTGIASALAVPEAKKWWKPLRALFEANSDERVNGFATALAAALSAAADDDLIGDLTELAQDKKHGEHRAVLLNAFTRSARPEARHALEKALEDPQLAKEARVQLRWLARRERQ